MNWDTILSKALTVAAANADLSDIFGSDIYGAGNRDFRVPSLEASLVADTELENETDVLTQWDIWVRTETDLLDAERALRALFHQDRGLVLDGLAVRASYEGGRPMAGPDEDGVLGRSLDFRFNAARS